MQKAKVISVVGEKVTLSFEDGATFVVPVSAIEGTVKEGQEAALLIVALGGEDAGRQKIAQDLLNGLLKG